MHFQVGFSFCASRVTKQLCVGFVQKIGSAKKWGCFSICFIICFYLLIDRLSAMQKLLVCRPDDFISAVTEARITKLSSEGGEGRGEEG